MFCIGGEREKGKVLERSSKHHASFEFCKLFLYTLDRTYVSVAAGLLETSSGFNDQLSVFSRAQTGNTAMYGHRLESPGRTCLR